MVTRILDNFIHSPRVLKYAGGVGVLLLVSPFAGLMLNILKDKYDISSSLVYLAYAPGIIVYWWGLVSLLHKKGAGFFILLLGWMMDSWCIYPFLNAENQGLHLSSFVFLSVLGMVLVAIMALNKELKYWLNSSRKSRQENID